MSKNACFKGMSINIKITIVYMIPQTVIDKKYFWHFGKFSSHICGERSNFLYNEGIF